MAVTLRPDGRPFDWSDVLGDLLVIRSSTEAPADAAVAVSYRGSWFYIEDSDISSNYTFMLLTQLTAIQAGAIERTAPVLICRSAGSPLEYRIAGVRRDVSVAMKIDTTATDRPIGQG